MSSNFIFVSDATKITLAPSNADINQGENVSLQCHASHDPTMDLSFSWNLNGVVLDLEDSAGPYHRIEGVSMCVYVFIRVHAYCPSSCLMLCRSYWQSITFSVVLTFPFQKENIGDLMILNAQLSQAGVYTCTAQTVVDSASAVAKLVVRGKKRAELWYSFSSLRASVSRTKES